MCDSAEVNNAMMAMGKGTTWNQIPTKPGSTVSRPIGGHYQFSLPAADEERLGRLFQELDHDKDGRINISDLSKSLARLGRHNAQGQAEAVIKQGDTSRSGDLTISEFLHYMVEHERKLKFAFSALDRNKDGRIDVDEITSSFSALGIGLDREEAKRLLRR
ncbi:unnamed protein product [Cyprideis torosa]|uniref:Uncharacterized protein n=1 Tax=Cyprideis torosa TaxID=163714 RepID=A0A7R8ZZX1_9CRUS|nr:unnamed protein product [Cyprideis torosa]CAG0910168.1 unnamed protein product [Cyprideis torosa]